MNEMASIDAAHDVALTLSMANDVAGVPEPKDADVSVDARIALTQTSQATRNIPRDDVGTDKPSHGQNGSCCGGCGG
jgi:hypothetical protein